MRVRKDICIAGRIVLAKKLSELRAKEEEINRDLADGIRAESNNITLNDMFESWRTIKVGLKEHTLANYVYMYNHFVRESIGTLKIQSIRKSDLLRFYNTLIGEGRNKVAINTRDILEKGLTFIGSSRSGRADFEKAVELMESKDFQKRIKIIIKRTTSAPLKRFSLPINRYLINYTTTAFSMQTIDVNIIALDCFKNCARLKNKCHITKHLSIQSSSNEPIHPELQIEYRLPWSPYERFAQVLRYVHGFY